ncbi:MAG: zinc-dependent metalloprotease, partial [Myxococcota bacterium]
QFLGQYLFCDTLHDDLDTLLVGLAKELRGMSDEEKLLELRKRFFTGVMLHEIGHNVGLRHNFEGSYDSLNYHREFWDLEMSGQSEQQKLDAKQPEYKMSTVMDYSSRVNARDAGLGPYDAAAVKFGYGQLIETFDSAAAPGGETLKDWRFLNDYLSLPGHLGGVDAMYERRSIVWDWNDPDQQRASFVQQTLQDEVPYMFCSDEFADWLPTCRRRDVGANAREQQAGNYILYNNYFPFTNFLRGRLQLNANSILNRSFGIFREVGMLYQYMYLYRSLDENFLNTPAGADMATAVADGLNMLAEVVGSPDPGEYYGCVNGAGDKVYYSSSLLDFDPSDEQFYGDQGELCDLDDLIEVQLGQSQPLFLGFSEDFVTYTFNYFGNYWDKLAALDVMTFPRARYFRVNDIEDRRTFSVSPFRVYDREVLDVMSGLIGYNRPSLSNYVDLAGQEPVVVGRSLLDVNQPLQDLDNPIAGAPSSLPKIVPSLARNLQRRAVLVGTALLTSPLDDTLDFAKYTRVWVKGAIDDLSTFDSVDPAERVECTLPGIGQTYRSIAVENTFNLGFDMVTDCARFVVELAVAESEEAVAQTALDDAMMVDPGSPLISDLELELAIAQDRVN